MSSVTRVLALALVSVCAWSGPASADPAPVTGPLATNPFLGPLGTATMHGDAGSSDVTPLAGPAPGAAVTVYPLGAACPTLLQGADGLVVGLCTAIAGQTPTVFLFDSGAAGGALASLPLTKGSLLGGVYAYLDNEDRLVVVDGGRRLLRVAHGRGEDGAWRLAATVQADLGGAIPQGDNVTGLVPDWAGNVWFATGQGVLGFVGPDGRVGRVALPFGESVANSISSAPNNGVAVASTHALYELRAKDGQPEILWRSAYDRGSARKPGQLSWGTGSTPTYFGPVSGDEYVTIVDNADGAVHLIVARSGSGEQVCSVPIPVGGSENSPIAIGSSIFVASTYGYPYPAVPEGAGPAVPASAPFRGGLSRVDITEDGCVPVWDSPIRSAAVPRLSLADGGIHTLRRIGPDLTSPLDGFEYVVLDPQTGVVRASTPLPGTVAEDPLQMAALITHGRALWQGTVTGIVRVG
ncbi:hypothetical protein ACFWUP_22780 [Nocardia sp. NPDC058658]|uniref:hypothetical protein n=1 Tax=Nocardia sp. NPDC058658 TaxID=3346580 RepID=UPI00365DAA8C